MGVGAIFGGFLPEIGLKKGLSQVSERMVSRHRICSPPMEKLSLGTTHSKPPCIDRASSGQRPGSLSNSSVRRWGDIFCKGGNRRARDGNLPFSAHWMSGRASVDPGACELFRVCAKGTENSRPGFVVFPPFRDEAAKGWAPTSGA